MRSPGLSSTFNDMMASSLWESRSLAMLVNGWLS
jgi:hypothetical protein